MTTTNVRIAGTLTQADTAARMPIGTPYTDQITWKRYCYVYNAGSTSWTVGVPVGIFLTATTYGECSFTAATQLLINDGTTDITAPAGIALGTIATTEFGWIQVGGFCTNVVTDGTMEASVGGQIKDNGIAVVISTEPEAHGIFCIGVTADVGNLSSNILLFDCVLDHH